MIPALRMIQRNALVYRRSWRGTVFFSFLQPTLFLVAMGLGVGALVDRGDTSLLGGVSFLHFLAPGLLASTSMQTASFDSSFPIAGKLTWYRNYEAIHTTPMRVADIVLGELGWIGLRVASVATAFMIVMTLFGVPRSPVALLAIPAAVLTGLAFSGPVMAYATVTRTGADFSGIFRFVITPLAIFSGVFFPITRLPAPLQRAAWFTPLFHGVELVRGLTLDTLDAGSSAWRIHVAYLAVMVAAGALTSVVLFRRRLYA